MKKTVIMIITAVLASFSLPLFAQQPAFPGAEGFGMYTTGGRGGEVYHVTTLDDYSTNVVGTLRYGLEAMSGVRTIVFDVSGTIHLVKALQVKKGNVTIAGQTAPGDGICIADYPFTINSDNVIIRYMRFRLGNDFVEMHEGDGLGSMDHNNIIVDHCSVSWSIDECCSVYGGKNITVQWCMIDQSLVNSGHSKGAHGYGGNWGGSGCSYHHNLLAHHTSRAPRLGPRYTTQTDERLDMRNNVIYNWGGLGCYGGEGMNVNIVNNYYKPGPGTPNSSVAYRIASPGIRTESYVATYPTYKPMLHVWGTYFVEGNVNPKYPDVTADNWTNGIYAQVDTKNVDGLWNDEIKKQIKRTAPITVPTTTTHSAEVAYEKVLNFAGASLSRDSHDAYIVNDVRTGTAKYGNAKFQGGTSSTITGFVNSPYEAGGYPDLKETALPDDSDRDGIPDTWEKANGLNPNDATDGAKVCSDGYTNLEHYLNFLVEDITEKQNADDTPQTQTITISQTTYTGSNPATHWMFESGVSVDNTADKAYATGSSGHIKYSAEKQFTINLPAGVSVSAVTFTGYDNYDTGASYIKELCGTEYAATDYVFPSSKATVSHTIELTSPKSGSLTFTVGNLQTVMSISLTLTSSTGISQTVMVSPAGNSACYNLAGQRVSPTAKGLLIRNGKKIFVK